MSEDASTATHREWDARSYHRVSGPQFGWGMRVLDRVVLQGDETVLDAGCGSGRLTAELLRRLPRGRVVAVDQSANMLAEARSHLEPEFGKRVRFVQADLARLRLDEPVDGVFSTATFHWVLDHESLFASLLGALRPGGWLIAQCGGAGNLDRLHAHAGALMRHPRWVPAFRQWNDPWHFADPDETARRLRAAGFTGVETGLESAPTPFSTGEDFRVFLETVVLRHHLARLSEPEQGAFLDALVALAAGDDPPYMLDYVRLNLQARRPG